MTNPWLYIPEADYVGHIFRFVDPEDVVHTVGGAGLRLVTRRIEPLPGGKAFEVLRFERT